MTNSKQLIAMIRSHAARDDERFLAIAEHIAVEADRSGRSKVADEIKGVIEAIRKKAPERRDAQPVPIAAPRGELIGLVRASYPTTNLSDLVLNPDLRRRVNRVIREHRERDALEEKGLSPRRKFLFSGPPGTGKSMTAAAIAGELGLPIFTVLLDGVITKYMGETAAKLRLIFDSMKSVRAVYLFDEVDAIATRRGAENDVGEARRMLNSFLQFLEEDQSHSIIVATTNQRSLLDPAIFRRFHAAFPYAHPSREEARQVMLNHLMRFELGSLDWRDVDLAASDLSQADLVAAAEDAARDAVLDHRGELTTETLITALRDRVAIHGD